jgi:hypothetical protein
MVFLFLSLCPLLKNSLSSTSQWFTRCCRFALEIFLMIFHTKPKNFLFHILLVVLNSELNRKKKSQPDEASVHSDDSNVDNLSMTSDQSQQPTTPSSENGRIRPTRPAPSIPTGLSRNGTRRSAPPPPKRTTELRAAPRRSAPPLQRQGSQEDNTAYTVRTHCISC